jgi:SUKH superfamily protein
MSVPPDSPFRTPTSAEIAAAEARLGMAFHADYKAFLSGGSDVANSLLEPAVILPDGGHLDLFRMADAAWRLMNVPRDWLPFVEDNGDYFCLTPTGEIVFWSHNGATDERWPNIAAWRQQVCVEKR